MCYVTFWTFTYILAFGFLEKHVYEVVDDEAVTNDIIWKDVGLV